MYGVRRSPDTRVKRRVAVWGAPVHGRLVCSMNVVRRTHRTANDDRDGARLVGSRFRVHALLWADMAELGVVRGLH